MKQIDLIIPVYNEEEVLPYFMKQIIQTVDQLPNYHFKFLFINDGSTDQSLRLLRSFSEKDERVSYIDLSRNFGKETAMLAGFDHAEGDAVIVIDADLQQPPETIREMLSWWEKGYEDVYAVRVKREGETEWKKWTSKLYYQIVQKMTNDKVYPSAGDFRLLDKKCIHALRELRESERYTKGMYGWIGFKKKEIGYIAEERMAGETKWNLGSLFKLAVDGITSYSTVPLKIWSYVGFSISFVSFLYLAYEIIKTLLFGTNVAGYPTLLAAILFLGGIQLISLGVIGEYLGRVFIETKGRPPYFIRETSDPTEAEDMKKFKNEDFSK